MLRLTKINKISTNSILSHILNVFQRFYVSTIQYGFCKVTSKLRNMSELVALQGAHVHGNTLCVTFGASHFRTYFRSFTLCSKYIVIPMVLGTHVLRTTLCVTFGARPRPLPAVPLERLFGQLGAKTAQGLRNGSARRPFGPPMSPTNVLRTLLRHARSYIRTSRRATSVVGSAMHMKWPDGIGREAGIGRTQNWKELTIFRACP